MNLNLPGRLSVLCGEVWALHMDLCAASSTAQVQHGQTEVCANPLKIAGFPTDVVIILHFRTFTFSSWIEMQPSVDSC